MKIAVTGANGFIGRRLCLELSKKEIFNRPLVRSSDSLYGVSIGNIGPHTDWSLALSEINCVVHCAGRAHIIKEISPNPWAEYWKVNVDGVINLARQSAELGVRKFIFLSSIGVMGSNTNNRGPFSILDNPDPKDLYAISKWEAEKALHQIARNTGLEVTIIRPPLVYGQDVSGNFLRLVRLIESKMPLPFGGIKNKRGYVSIDNLISLIMNCIYNQAAIGKTFLVSDLDDISTPDLIKMLAKAMNMKVRLFGFPYPLIYIAAYLLGRGSEIKKLANSLEIDIGYTLDTLNWNPVVSVDEGLRHMFTSP